MNAFTVTRSLVAVSIAAACAASGCVPDEAPARPPVTAMQQAQTSSCPLGVPGAHVVVDDIDSGVALTFTSTSDRLGDLRERANDAAKMHGPGEHLGKGHDGRHGTGGEHGLKGMQLPPSRAVEEDIAGGARISLWPADAADLALLRSKARERAEAMMSACR